MNESPLAVHGDVDADGEIVDRVRVDERLRSAIGEYRAAGISLDSRLDLVRTLLARAARAVSA